MNTAGIILKILDGLLVVGLAGGNMASKVQTIRDKVKVWVDEDRDPSEAEWAELDQRHEAASSTIQDWKSEED